jgi:hypothetical protein
LTISGPVSSVDPACAGEKTYTFTYTDCTGATYQWVYTYTIEAPVVAMPSNEGSTVACCGLHHFHSQNIYLMNYALTGKKVVFTGGTSGLGRIALKFLIEQNAEIFVFYRNAALVGEFRNLSNVELIECDLSSLASVKNAIELVKSKTDVLDILVNNAGLWEFNGFAQTEDQLERTFQVNLLVPFILAESFLPMLKKADAPKVINTASALHQGKINFADLQFAQKFSGFKAYRQSKLGIILLTSPRDV